EVVHGDEQCAWQQQRDGDNGDCHRGGEWRDHELSQAGACHIQVILPARLQPRLESHLLCSRTTAHVRAALLQCVSGLVGFMWKVASLISLPLSRVRIRCRSRAISERSWLAISMLIAS